MSQSIKTRHPLEVLRERGFIQQCTDEERLGALLDEGQMSFYCGLDPTASSLHAGHLVPLFAMAHLSRAGHRAIALVGGGTARIGDPSGRSETRRMMSIEQIKANAEAIGRQIERFVDLDAGNGMMVDNAEWLADLNYIEFLRDIGRHFSVNRMLSFETYKARLEGGLSFIEFNYQLLQSYDFLVLNQKYGCRLQIGGDDQWGNIVAGVDLIRRVEGGEAFGLTCPLVTRSDGKKMGKTEKGALYLDPSLVSPYEFYQYWRNVPDSDVEKFLLLYTFMPVDEIRELASLRDAEINRAKERLAFELTKTVHGADEAEQARAGARAAFASGPGGGDLSSIPMLTLTRAEVEGGIAAVELFSRTSLCSSKSEARRLIDQGGATVNDRKVTSLEELIDSSWANEGQLLLRAGKKRYFRIVIE